MTAAESCENKQLVQAESGSS